MEKAELPAVYMANLWPHGLNLIQAWISNYIHYKVWGEIIYPFLNFNGANDYV